MNGIIIIDKPLGITSHDCVNHIRKTLKTKKVGHAGTLDPLATGVLVVGVNDALKAFEYLENDDKTYEFRVCLGKATTTYDSEGEVILDADVSLTENEIDQIIPSFVGASMQMPPLYSALKKDGKPLYYYARNNIEVDVDKRQIEIYQLSRTSKVEKNGKYCYCSFLAHVSKGTYIRSLAFDLGQALNVPSSIVSLRRIQSGRFNIEKALKPDDIREDVSLLNVADYLPFPKYEVLDLDLKKKINNGVSIHKSDLKRNEECIMFTLNQEIFAIYKLSDDLYKALKVWVKS